LRAAAPPPAARQLQVRFAKRAGYTKFTLKTAGTSAAHRFDQNPTLERWQLEL